MSHPRIRAILVADKRADYRVRYIAILQRLFDLIAEETGSFDEAMRLSFEREFNLIVVGEKLDHGDGLTLIRHLRAINDQALIIYIGSESLQELETAKASGANEAILKTPWLLNRENARTDLFTRLGLT